jgi:uncharacterized membrane protein
VRRAETSGLGSAAVGDPAPRRDTGAGSEPTAGRSETRWEAALAVLAAAGLQGVLPEHLTVGPSWLLPTLEVALLIPLAVANRSGRESGGASTWRRISVASIALVNAANIASLGLLIHSLLNGSKSSGKELILAAVGIWLTSLIVFALWYWQVDRGGPVARVRLEMVRPDLFFPQMANPELAEPGWSPGFVDYLYVSLTNCMAFSPTDTMPLTPRAKLLMGAQSLVSLATIAIVGSRAVNILN